MSSYKKYVMMGATTILLALGKLIIQKMMSKFTEASKQGSHAEENEVFTPGRRPSERRA